MDFIEWPDGALGTALRWLITGAVVYVAVLWVALVAWTYRDIRQRSRDPLMQFVAILVVLLFFLPGHWIYLILRPRYTMKEVYDRALEEEALLQELEEQRACASCRRRVEEDWLLCPSCGLQLKEPCETCQRPLSYAWVVCPHCGTEKAPRPGPAIRSARARPGVAARASTARLDPAAGAARPALGAATDPAAAIGRPASPAGERATRRTAPRPRRTPAPVTTDDAEFVIGASTAEE